MQKCVNIYTHLAHNGLLASMFAWTCWFAHDVLVSIMWCKPQDNTDKLPLQSPTPQPTPVSHVYLQEQSSVWICSITNLIWMCHLVVVGQRMLSDLYMCLRVCLWYAECDQLWLHMHTLRFQSWLSFITSTKATISDDMLRKDRCICSCDSVSPTQSRSKSRSRSRSWSQMCKWHAA